VQPHVRAFETRSPPLAFLSVVLAFMGISDLVSLGMPEEISLLYHWGTQGRDARLYDEPKFCSLSAAPLRLTLSLGIVIYTFLTGSHAPLSSSNSRGFSPSHGSASSWSDGLKNDMVFAFAFVEMISWFWVWVTLREERGELVRKSLKDSRGRGRDDRDD